MKAVRVYMVSLFLLLTTVSSVSAQEQAYKSLLRCCAEAHGI